jgi:hypothetical protein
VQHIHWERTGSWLVMSNRGVIKAAEVVSTILEVLEQNMNSCWDYSLACIVIQSYVKFL